MIIDACCLSRVFNINNAEHERFKAVYAWLVTGKGRMIYGGTTYDRELKAASRILVRIGELIKGQKLKVERIDDGKVDEHEKRVKELCNDKKFNDPHLVAIVCVSRCRLVCTDEQEAVPFLKMKKLYSDDVKVPKIYSSDDTCSELLKDKKTTDY